MKRPRPSSSDRQARPYRQLARMSSGGGTPPTQQRGLEWEFDLDDKIICHRALNEENCDEEACKICLRFRGHIHPRNGQPGSLQRAKSDRDRWFLEYPKSPPDPSSDSQSLDAEDLDSQASQDSDLERVQTELSVKCSEVEQLRTQLRESQNALDLAHQSKSTLIAQNLRLKADCRKSNEECRRFRGKSSRLEGQYLATNELLRAARRDLENARQELAQVRPSTPNQIQGAAPASSALALSCGQSQDEDGRVYIVISP